MVVSNLESDEVAPKPKQNKKLGEQALYILDYIVLNDTPLFGSVKKKYYLSIKLGAYVLIYRLNERL